LIFRVELTSFLAQRLMKLKLNDVTHKVSDIRNISDDVVLASRVKIIFRPGYRWLNSLIRISAIDASFRVIKWYYARIYELASVQYVTYPILTNVESVTYRIFIRIFLVCDPSGFRTNFCFTLSQRRIGKNPGHCFKFIN